MTDTDKAGEGCRYTQFACIGTGFSGIGLGATLKRWYDISDVQFFERHQDLGGTWFANRYPGCACDIPSALFSLSYEPNPDWSRVLPPSVELWEYLDRVAAKYDLRPRMTFRAEVKKAEWIEERARWRLTVERLENGDEFLHECQFLFGATGQLVRPKKLDVPGLESFEGRVSHSAEWPEDLDLTGKRVVVFGNGCTGAQVVPAIVGQTKHLTHIVRTKHWILPGVDQAIDDNTRAILKNPIMGRLSRFAIFAFAEDQLRYFYTNWDGNRYRKKVTKQAEDYMRKMAPAKYHDMLIPDFEVGCRRRIFDPGYLASLHAENLELTDTAVEKIVAEGVRLVDGRLIEADVIVACNGFETEDFMSPMEVIGVNGETIKDHWAKFAGRPEAYNCSVMSGFPNFFAILGPNSLTGHTSAIMASENSINYALRVIKPLLDGQGTTAELSFDAEQKYVYKMQDALSKTVLATGCGSWYVSKLDNGKEWNMAVYPWTQGHYWWRSLFPVWRDWQFRVSGTPPTAFFQVTLVALHVY
ncbi:monooxygenase [Cryphonectria parasitica EP155]|uniref:Monooxygenase n=1 Tax=Cryphonectria parasitica (strain ATCC 38755 / EP155) TaxID=660469 RepID=A0A9P4Y5F0_CRYP1|nr:monooxygenase [Cryphonectria parasitica EP155]KAF3766799.1 monooxygenase [Cryphonectria parasitica EP155]